MNILVVMGLKYMQKFYGQTDYSIGYIVKELLDNKSKIFEYFQSKDTISINKLDDYIDYVWINNIKLFKSIESKVVEELKNDFHELIEYINSFKFTREKILNYLKENYDYVFDENNYRKDIHIFYEVINEAVNTIYTYHDFFDIDIYDFIENRFAYIIVNDIISCENFYQKHPERFSKMFDLADNQHFFDIRNFHNTFNSLSKSKKKFVKDLLYSKTQLILKKVIKLAEQINEDNYLENSHYIDQIILLVKTNSFNFIEQYKFDELQDKIKDASAKYFKKHGHEFKTGPIDLKDLLERMKIELNSDMSFFSFLSLTHHTNKNEKRLTSNLIQVFNVEKSLTDMIASSPNTDEYFTQSRLMSLHFHIEIYCRVLYLMLVNDDLLIIIKNHMNIILHDIDKNEGDGKLELASSIEGMFDSFMNNVKNPREVYTDKEKYECYSLSMFLVSLIEKILRKVTINRSFTQRYYADDDLNLGDILRTSNNNGTKYENVLNGILDYELIRVLEFKLAKTHDSNIGENLRNNLMHNRNINFSDISNGILIQVFYLFLSVINGIYSSYLNHNMKMDCKSNL